MQATRSGAGCRPAGSLRQAGADMLFLKRPHQGGARARVYRKRFHVTSVRGAGCWQSPGLLATLRPRGHLMAAEVRGRSRTPALPGPPALRARSPRAAG